MNSQAIDKSESAGSRGRKDHYDRYYSYNRYSGLALILLSLSFACSIIADASCLSFLAPLTVFNGPSETDTVSYTFSSVLLLVILIYPMICLSRFRAGSPVSLILPVLCVLARVLILFALPTVLQSPQVEAGELSAIMTLILVADCGFTLSLTSAARAVLSQHHTSIFASALLLFTAIASLIFAISSFSTTYGSILDIFGTISIGWLPLVAGLHILSLSPCLFLLLSQNRHSSLPVEHTGRLSLSKAAGLTVAVSFLAGPMVVCLLEPGSVPQSFPQLTICTIFGFCLASLINCIGSLSAWLKRNIAGQLLLFLLLLVLTGLCSFSPLLEIMISLSSLSAGLLTVSTLSQALCTKSCRPLQLGTGIGLAIIFIYIVGIHLITTAQVLSPTTCFRFLCLTLVSASIAIIIVSQPLRLALIQLITSLFLPVDRSSYDALRKLPADCLTVILSSLDFKRTLLYGLCLNARTIIHISISKADEPANPTATIFLSRLVGMQIIHLSSLDETLTDKLAAEKENGPVLLSFYQNNSGETLRGLLPDTSMFCLYSLSESRESGRIAVSPLVQHTVLATEAVSSK